MIFVRFQGKPFNITVIQVYAPTSNAEEAEVEQFYEDLQDLLELTAKKDVLFIIGDWNAKVRSQDRGWGAGPVSPQVWAGGLVDGRHPPGAPRRHPLGETCAGGHGERIHSPGGDVLR